MEQGMSDRYQCGICSKCGSPLFAFRMYGNEIHIECGCVTAEREKRESAEAEMKKKRAAERRILQSGMPPKLQSMTFDNFEARPGTKQTLKRCKLFVERFGSFDTGIILVGPTGSGKTHLACAILNAVIHRGYSGKFIRAVDIPYEIQKTYTDPNASEYDVIEPLRNAALLVIDDLGADKMTDFDRAQIQSLIDYRINFGRPTICTTNLVESEISEVIDTRTADRLFGYKNNAVLFCDAPSYRKIKRKKEESNG